MARHRDWSQVASPARMRSASEVISAVGTVFSSCARALSHGFIVPQRTRPASGGGQAEHHGPVQILAEIINL